MNDAVIVITGFAVGFMLPYLGIFLFWRIRDRRDK